MYAFPLVPSFFIRPLTTPYTTVLRRDEDNDVIARVEQLPGCVGHGTDEAEAIKSLREMQMF